MDAQAALIPEEPLYDRMKRRGVDMGWYDRSRAKRGKYVNRGQAHLSDETCSELSIYLLKQDGSLWTIQQDGSAYQEVRPARKPIAHDVLLCVCCKKQFKTITEAHKHQGETK